MAKFEIVAEIGKNYDEKLEVTIRLKQRPDKEDFELVGDAIRILEGIYLKYTETEIVYEAAE